MIYSNTLQYTRPLHMCDMQHNYTPPPGLYRISKTLFLLWCCPARYIPGLSVMLFREDTRACLPVVHSQIGPSDYLLGSRQIHGPNILIFALKHFIPNVIRYLKTLFAK